jgi:hypothetical protein
MAACPASIVQLRYFDGPFSVAGAVYDSTTPPVWTTHVAFDRVQCRLALATESGGRHRALVRVVDAFDLSGVSPGLPVDGVLELHLDGFADQNCGGSGCGVEFTVVLRAGADSVAADLSGQFFGRRDLPSSLSLPVTLVAGSPLQVECLAVYSTGPGGSASAQVAGVYGVSGLPPGVRAISCAGADATGARDMTWGSLKLRYR